MKNFLSTVKGKVVAGAITLAVIAAVVAIVLLNTGYRTIRVDDLNGTTEITKGASVTEAVKGQNLKSECDVFVEEESDLTLELDEDKHVFADELTRFSLEAVGKPGKDSRTVIKLDEGSVLSEIDEKLGADESYVVKTPNATMAVRGTVFTVTVRYDEEGLCHTLVEVEEGKVKVTKKGEKGDTTDKVQTLEEGEKTEVISLVKRDDDDKPSPGNSSSGNTSASERVKVTYQDPEALAVEAALETFLNGGELDTTNFNRVTLLKIYGKIAFVTLDNKFGGKEQSKRDASIYASGPDVWYLSDTGEEIRITTEYNSLTNIDFLTEMKNLRILTFSYSKVNDIIAIRQLSGLTDLDLSYNEISDISPLENITKLTYLNLEHNSLSDISHIGKLINMSALDLSNNNISDLSPISGMSKLLNLSITHNNISDLSPLNGLEKLNVLNASVNNISDLSPISGLTRINSLYIDLNNISDLSPISGLTKMRTLSFRNNNISDLSPISELTNLYSLFIDGENLSDISPIVNLKQLSNISIYSKSIKDYSPLYELTNLRRIDLYNDISDNELAELQQALLGVNISKH